MTWTHVAGVVSREAFALHEVSDRLDGVVWESEDAACTTLDSMLVWFAGSSGVFEARADDVRLEITALRDLDQRTRAALTRPRYEALRAAYDRGYFEVPREIDLQELAAELDISHQALGERLRRAKADLVEQTIFAEGTTVARRTSANGSPVHSFRRIDGWGSGGVVDLVSETRFRN